MTKSVDDLIGVLNALPPRRVEEVYNFALFLKTRACADVDESDEWTEEDKADVIAASLAYAESQEATE